MSSRSRPPDQDALRATTAHVRAGREHEGRAEVDEAVAAYVSGGAFEEAARVLISAGRYHDAGVVLLRGLPARPTPVLRLDARQRQYAMSAALNFARAGSRREAVGLLMNLGQHQRAASLLNLAGLRQDAVRAMRGEPVEGSPWPPGVLFPLDGSHEASPQWSGMSPTVEPARPSASAPWEAEGGDLGATASTRSRLADLGSWSVSRTPPPEDAPHAAPRSRPGTPPPGPSRGAVPPAFVTPSASSTALPPAFAGRGVSGGHGVPGRSLPSVPTVSRSSDVSPHAAAPRAQEPPRSAPFATRGGGPEPEEQLARGPSRVSGGALGPPRTSAPPAPRAPGPPGDGSAWPPPQAEPAWPPASSDSWSPGEPSWAGWSPEAEPPAPPPRPTGFRPGRRRFGSTAPGAAPPSQRLVRAESTSLDQQELASWISTAPSDRTYPVAVGKVVALVWRKELLPPQAITFLDDFLRLLSQAPPPRESWSTLYAVGRLYEFHDRVDAAKAAYRAVLAADPTWMDAALRLENIEEGLAEGADGHWHPVSRLIDGSQPFAPLPRLDELPGFDEDDVSDLRPPRSAPARGGSAADTMDFDDFNAALPESMRRRTRTTDDGAGRSGGYRGDMPAMDADGRLLPGAVIADRYRIEAFVGAGGMAAVYKARDQELEEIVALKLFQQVLQNKAGLDRFRREMKLSRKLLHPNIVRIYEFGTWHGARFITMELLQGQDLEEFLAGRGGKLDLVEGLGLLMQACDGIGAAHQAGVVHRDVKPQNLFITEEGKRLKVMDFGIAKASDGNASLSASGVRVGTPRYMSPEQIQGDGEIGPAADLYALGGVMYEVLTGTPPFREEELVPLLLCHMTETPDPPSKRNPAIPRVLEDIILKLLSKSPGDRFADCQALKKALLRAYVEIERGG